MGKKQNHMSQQQSSKVTHFSLKDKTSQDASQPPVCVEMSANTVGMKTVSIRNELDSALSARSTV
jgi:hypothetical protein